MGSERSTLARESVRAADDAAAGGEEPAHLRMALYVAAAFAAAQAVQLRDGFSHPGAFCWVTLGVLAVLATLFVGQKATGVLRYLAAAMLAASILWPAWAVIQTNCADGYQAEQHWLSPFFLVATLVALAVPAVLRGRLVKSILHQRLAWVVAAMLAWQFVQLLTYRVGSEWADDHGFHAGARFYMCIGVAMAGSACVLLLRGAWRHVGMLLALAAFAVIGQWVIEAQKPPFFDVWFAQDRGVRHFLAGHNPYTASYESIWENKEAVPPGSKATQWLQGGFAYSPWTFYLDLPAYRLAGDVRYAHLACMMLAALLLANMKRGALGGMLGLLLLFTPRAFFLLESAWTEPHVIAVLALLLLAALYRPKLTAALLGVFLASKQYLLFAIAPAVFLVRPWSVPRLVRTAAIAIVVACALSLPLVIWNWPALLHGDRAEVARNVRIYVHSCFESPASHPLHDDALSYLGWVKTHTGISLPKHGSFVVALLATPLLIWRYLRSPAGYAAAVGAVYLLFFATAKFTYCGYYYLVVACFCAAASAENALRHRNN